MKLHRFIGVFDLDQSEITVQDWSVVRQMKDVLRLGVGDEVVLGDGQTEALARITALGDLGATLEILRMLRNENEPIRQVTLFAASLKRENFELIVQKCTEVGVAAILPLVTERTVKLGLKLDRLGKIAREAAEQCGRVSVPEMRSPIRLEEAITYADQNELNLFCHMNGEPFIGMRRSIRGKKKVGVFIGPEGGWTDSEIGLARARNFQIMSLGKLTLRGETAAIISTYLAATA